MIDYDTIKRVAGEMRFSLTPDAGRPLCRYASWTYPLHTGFCLTELDGMSEGEIREYFKKLLRFTWDKADWGFYTKDENKGAE